MCEIAEPMFAPPLEGGDASMSEYSKSIPSLIAESINNVDHDIRKEMYNNILTTGGGV
jgi:actin-related protein